MFANSQRESLDGSRAVPSDSGAVAAAKAAGAGKLLKRSEAARVLGVSVSTLRRREGELLNPIVGTDGVHMFDEAEVRAVTVTMRGRTSLAAMGPSAGDIAADVFSLLDDSVHPVEIVKRLRLTPDVVVALNEQWSRMRGGFTVGPQEAAELGRVARTRAAKTAAEAIAQLRSRVTVLTRMRQGTSVCHSCRDSTASICEACVIRTRGPLSDFGLRIERRVRDDGQEELRVEADFCWEDVGDNGGAIATFRTDWVPTRELDESAIADIVTGIQKRCSR